MLILAIPAFIFLYINSSPSAKIALTDEEQAYLQAVSPIPMAVDPDWEPFEKIDEHGNYIGIAADYVELIEKRLGIKFHIIPTSDWTQSIAYSKEGKVIVLPFLNKTEEREKWLTFTEPLLTDENAIIGRYNTPFINELSLETNKTVALPEGTSVEERIRRDYPNLAIRLTKSEAETFELVSNGEADFTIRSMLIGAYNIRKQGWFDLQVIGKVPGYTNDLGMGVSKDHKKLIPILNKAILSITKQENADILNKHVPLRFEISGQNKRMLQFLVITIILSSLILIFSIIQSARTKKLKNKNAQIQAVTTRYEILSNLAGTFFWQVDSEGNYTYISPEVKKVLGYEVQELLGLRSNIRHILMDSIPVDGTLRNYETEETMKDGTRLWVNIHAIPLTDFNANLIGYQGTSTDIEHRKQLELALIQTKDEIELAYFQAQIAPHFLYNALSAIAMYCRTEPDKASKLILDLSFFLRKAYDFKSIKSLVPLEHELELIDAYVHIEQARFGERLRVYYDLDGVPAAQLIPPLILQPLIENAINHGIMKRVAGGTVTVKAVHEGDNIHFEVVDDGVGISELQYGVGLENIHSRLKKLYQSGLAVNRNEFGGTTVSFQIPVHLRGEEA